MRNSEVADLRPLVDGQEIPNDFISSVANHQINKVPIIWGSLSQEGDTFVYAAAKNPINDIVRKK